MLLGIEQKRADPDSLDGRLTVYATIEIDPDELINLKHPIASVINNGLLVAQGNYREQSSLRDFLKSELGLSLEEGLEEIIERMDGLESALDPQKLREKIEGMKEFEEFIPTPAKIVPFSSEQEILAQEGDIYYVGSFQNIGNANLSVNSFPILYQARYREQQLGRVRNEIESLIAQIEKGTEDTSRREEDSPAGQLRERILKEFVPDMLYHREKKQELIQALEQFRRFMAPYAVEREVEAIAALISRVTILGPGHFRLIELFAEKIEAIHSGNSDRVNRVSSQITALESELGEHFEGVQDSGA